MKFAVFHLIPEIMTQNVHQFVFPYNSRTESRKSIVIKNLTYAEKCYCNLQHASKIKHVNVFKNKIGFNFFCVSL